MDQANKSYVWIAVVAIAAGLIWFLFGRTEVIAITEDTTIAFDYVVEKGTRVEVTNGAVITVQGDTTIAGEIRGDEGGVAIVPRGNVTFAKSAKITSLGNVQIVSKRADLADTQEKIDRAFDEAGEDTGVGPRVGPFAPTTSSVANGEDTTASSVGRITLNGNHGQIPAFLAQSANLAYAHGEEGDEFPDLTVTLSGNIDLSKADSTDQKKRKKVVILSFPPSEGKVAMHLQDLTIVGPQNAPRGTDDRGTSCDAKGGNGADGLRLRGFAWNIEINNFDVTLTKGGDGGDAETKTDCDSGVARGGTGGDSGNMKLVADNSFKILGAFHLAPGKSGNGGNAIAHGKNGGPSEKGGSAYAYGGKGKDNSKELSVKGIVDGMSNVTIDVLVGGDGGNATANGGAGGAGVGCGRNGGAGGVATAEGGKGGDASLVVLGAPSPVFDIGGNGGNADAQGGIGGAGGGCDAKGKGGDGGKGGDASDKEGNGGAGDTLGIDGISASEGGAGGNGGDGCGEGSGGKGGSGDTPGKDGEKGKNLCVADQPKTTGKIGNDVPVTPVTSTAKMTFNHVAPGQYSEVYMDITGAPGAQANVTLSGPAVEKPGASGTVGSNGTLRLTWRIYQYGTYNASGTVGNSQVTGSTTVN